MHTSSETIDNNTAPEWSEDLSSMFDRESEPSPIDKVVTFWDEQVEQVVSSGPTREIKKMIIGEKISERRGEGSLIKVTFTEQSLGLSLVLSQIRENEKQKTIRRSSSEADIYLDNGHNYNGRRLVVVDQTFPERGGGIAHSVLRPHDELVAIESLSDGTTQRVIDLDVPGFDRLLTKLRSAPRPLTLIFSRPPIPTGKAGTSSSPNPLSHKGKGGISLRRRDAVPTNRMPQRKRISSAHSSTSFFESSDLSKSQKNKRRNFLLICHLVFLACTAFFRKLFTIFSPRSSHSTLSPNERNSDADDHPIMQPLLSSQHRGGGGEIERTTNINKSLWSHRRIASDPIQFASAVSTKQQQVNDLV